MSKQKQGRKAFLPKWAIFIIILAFILTAGIIGVVIYYIFNYVNYSNGNGGGLFDGQKNKNYSMPNEERYLQSFNAKTIVKNNVQLKNKNYQYGNLSIFEYPFALTKNNEPIYFLGEEGRKLLNLEFLKRGFYGPEINGLNHVYINKKIPNVSNIKDVNGVYLPQAFDIFIQINHFISGGTKQVLSWSLQKRVELVFNTLFHEYAHHIDNTYNRSIKENDEFANNDLSYKLATPELNKIINKFNGNNNKFLTEFRKTLNYDGSMQNDEYLVNKELFNPKNKEIPVYSKFSQYDLFKLANLALTNKEVEKYNILNNKNFYFNNSTNNTVYYANSTNIDQIKYLFSFEELFARELVKLSYSAHENFQMFDGHLTLDDSLNFLYYKLKNDDIFLSSIGDDTLKMIANYYNKYVIYSANWVFDDELKNYKNINNRFLFRNKQGKYIYKPNQQVKALLKAYIDLMGFGQPISYMGSDISSWYIDHNGNINSQYSNINIGGFLNLENSLIDPNSKKSKYPTYLLFQKENKNPLKLRIHTSKYNFIAKSRWNEIYSKNLLNEESIYSNNVKNYEYVSYFSDSVGINEIKDYTNQNNYLNLKLWVDKNNNNKIESDEISSIVSSKNILDKKMKELSLFANIEYDENKSLHEQVVQLIEGIKNTNSPKAKLLINEIIDLYNSYFLTFGNNGYWTHQQNNKRNVTNFRKTMEWYDTEKQTTKNLIYSLNLVNNNDEVNFEFKRYN